MDKFRMMFQFLQANQESFMNGICGIMALASAQLYDTFELTCPCLPEYNYAYGVGILVIPPIWFFMLGYVLNNNISMLTEEWRRPEGQRQKEPTVLRYMFVSMTQRALIAPTVWIAVTLMDGKSFLCAYSARLDLQRFLNQSVDMSENDLQKLLATIPCEKVFDAHNVISRDAAIRYIRCISQACGWTFLMLTTLIAFLIRGIRPCFTQAIFLKTKYWSHYIDTERRLFDETCKEHAKSFAKVCIQQYFKSIGGEMPFHSVDMGLQKVGNEKGNEEDHPESEQEKLLGVCEKEDMNKVLWNWHTCKPALSLYKLRNELSNATISNGFHSPKPMNEHVAYYSKV